MKNNYSKNKKCLDCGCLISNQATRCKSCSKKNKNNPLYKHGNYVNNQPDHYSHDRHCIECGKLISNEATYCLNCVRKNDRSPTWNGGQSTVNTRQRDYHIDYYIWRKKVLAKDNFICQHCGSKIKLRTHHIESYKNYPELRIDINNGITLCEYHHNQLHHLFGKIVTPEQLKWFLENVK